MATLGGYLLSLRFGLFGFTEVRTTAGIVAGLIDVAAFATLVLAAAPALPAALKPGRRVVPAVAAASVVALALLAAGVASPKAQPVATGADVLKARDIGGVNLLTNAKGLTLYWFAPDSATKSACYGSCAVYWPPVTGNPSAGPGVTGKLGTITRSDGSTQATYDGHPLYTYIGDRGPGQDGGNNLNLNGGPLARRAHLGIIGRTGRPAEAVPGGTVPGEASIPEPFPEPTTPAPSRAEVFLRYLDYFRSRLADKLEALPAAELAPQPPAVRLDAARAGQAPALRRAALARVGLRGPRRR